MNRVAAKVGTGVLVITHYERILTYIKPGFVHILFGGKIVEDGGPELVTRLEAEGYDWIREKYPEAARDEDALDNKRASPRASENHHADRSSAGGLTDSTSSRATPSRDTSMLPRRG